MYLSIHDNPPNIANNLIGGKYIILISILSITIVYLSIHDNPPNIANNLIGGKCIFSNINTQYNI